MTWPECIFWSVAVASVFGFLGALAWSYNR